MKIVFSIIILISLSPIAFATIVTTSEGKITRMHTYDDHMGGTAYIYMDMPIEVCPSGAYLNSSSPGFERLYAMTMAAMMADKKVKFQLYDDRVTHNRCEVDAIQVSAN